MFESLRKWWTGYGFGTSYGGSGHTLYADGRPIPSLTTPAALGYPAVFRAVTLVSNDVARLEMEFESSELEALFSRPNPYMSGYELKRQLVMQALVYGNSFALINRRLNGSLLELVPLRVGSVTLDVSNPSGPTYRSTDFGVLQPEQVLHLRASSLDGLWATSPLTICSTAVNLGLITEESNLNSTQNGTATDKTAFVHPMNVNTAARQAIQADYLKNHTGAVNAGKPVVLGENMRVDKITGAINSAMNDARRYSVEEVGRIFGIPAAMLGSTQGNAYGSLEWMSKTYLNGCLIHWLEMLAGEIELKLGEKPYIDIDEVIRPGISETMTAMRTAIEAGILTQNEARDWIDYEAVPGGDQFMQALNLGTGGGQSNAGIDTSSGNSPGDVDD